MFCFFIFKFMKIYLCYRELPLVIHYSTLDINIKKLGYLFCAPVASPHLPESTATDELFKNNLLGDR